MNTPDLLETTIGDVTRTSSTWETSPAPDDINVATRSNELEEPKVECERKYLFCDVSGTFTAFLFHVLIWWGIPRCAREENWRPL